MIIYKVTNNINNKVYIGLTTQTLEQRKYCHLAEIKKGRLSHLYFYRAMRKYGIENFSWEIICETDSKSKLVALEKFYIAAYSKIGKIYNMTNGGEMNLYNPSIETRNKLREINLGKKLSEETKLKLRNINLGKKQSEETKLKRSISLKGRPSPMKDRKQSEYFIQQMKNRVPWNKGMKGNQIAWNKGVKNSTGNQKGVNNPSYRHDIKDEDIKKYLDQGISRKVISLIMNCSQRTIDRRINKWSI